MSMLGSFTKQPAEVESYTIDYSDDLTEGDNAVSTVAAVEPTGLTLGLVLVADPRVRIWVQGGAVGVTYKVTATTTTADGRVLQDEFKVRIKDY